MDSLSFLRALRRGWLAIVILMVAGAGAGFFMASVTEPEYQASASLFVSVDSQGSTTTGDLVQGASYAQQKVASYVLTIDTAIVLDPVIAELGLDTTAPELAQRVTAFSPQNTVFIVIETTDESPQLAADIANAVAASFRTVVGDQLEPAGDGSSRITVTEVQPAMAATSPVSPKLSLFLAVGAAAGLIIGAGAAVLRAVTDTRIRRVEDVEAVTGLPLLGAMVNDALVRKQPLITQVSAQHPRAEAYRTLRTNLRFAELGSKRKTLLVTSSMIGEAKTTTVANLGIAMAESGERAVIIDCDLRAPRLADYLGIEGSVGLTDVLLGTVTVDDALQEWGENGLRVLTAGQLPPNPTTVLESKAMVELIARLGRRFDHIVLDAPPVLPVPDATVLSKLADGVLLVVGSRRVNRRQLGSAVTALNRAGATLLGTVVTRLPRRGPDGATYIEYGQRRGARGQLAKARGLGILKSEGRLRRLKPAGAGGGS